MRLPYASCNAARREDAPEAMTDSPATASEATSWLFGRSGHKALARSRARANSGVTVT